MSSRCHSKHCFPPFPILDTQISILAVAVLLVVASGVQAADGQAGLQALTDGLQQLPVLGQQVQDQAQAGMDQAQQKLKQSKMRRRREAQAPLSATTPKAG